MKQITTITKDDKTILCISGGGIRGLAFVGALYELSLNQLNKFHTIAGCSIGAFIGACLIVGYTPEELLDYLFEFDFRNLKDIDIKNLLTHKSLMKGNKLHDFYRTTFARKLESPDISLQELYELTEVKFIVAVTCMNTQEIEYISYETHPNLSLHLLICMTTAIPGILPSISYNGKLYVDGAIVDNLPLRSLVNDNKEELNVAQENSKNSKIIVLTTQKKNEPFIDNHQFTFFTYFSTLLRLIYRNTGTSSIPTDLIIAVDTGNVSVTSFNITEDEKYALIHAGRSAVRRYFQS